MLSQGALFGQGGNSPQSVMDRQGLKPASQRAEGAALISSTQRLEAVGRSSALSEPPPAPQGDVVRRLRELAQKLRASSRPPAPPSEETSAPAAKPFGVLASAVPATRAFPLTLSLGAGGGAK
jgi:hypothetical protein